MYSEEAMESKREWVGGAGCFPLRTREGLTEEVTFGLNQSLSFQISGGSGGLRLPPAQLLDSPEVGSTFHRTATHARAQRLSDLIKTMQPTAMEQDLIQGPSGPNLCS